MIALLLAFHVAAAAPDPGKAAKAHLLNGGDIVTPDDYPVESLRNDEQGSVTVKLTVDSAGLVTGCTVVQSSGHPALDDKTCTLFRERAKFQPATDPSGNPRSSEYTQRISWALADSAPMLMPRSQWMTRMTVALTSDGKIVDCKYEFAGLAIKPGSCAPPAQARGVAKAQPTGFAITEIFFYPVDPEAAPKTPELPDSILASRQVSELTISPDGQIIACQPVEFSGADASHGDKCTLLDNFRFDSSKGDSPSAGTIVQSNYVRGTAAN